MDVNMYMHVELAAADRNWKYGDYGQYAEKSLDALWTESTLNIVLVILDSPRDQ